MPKVYRITSMIPGFRRAGLSHPARAVDHPAGSLTPRQIAALMAEPRLVVQELDLPDDPQPPLQLEGRADVDDMAAPKQPNQVADAAAPAADPAAAPGEPEPAGEDKAGDDKTGKPAKASKARADGE